MSGGPGRAGGGDPGDAGRGDSGRGDPGPGDSGPDEAAPESVDRTDVTDDDLLGECRVDTFRAGGRGGQHQNKTESGVRLTHGPSGIVVTARESRSQARNRRRALERLRAALAERARTDPARVPTRTPRRARERRLEEKRRRSETKRRRRKPRPDD